MTGLVLDTEPRSTEADQRARPGSPAGPRLSIVAPCYNEAESLPGFVQRMQAAAEAAAGASYELILVNDGSRDATWSLIEEMSQKSAQVVGVDLARNHGHQLAVTAGLSLVRGERVLIIDADLQDPPELVGAMMARMDEGYEVVYGRRRQRNGESAFKLATAKMFYRLLGVVSNIEIPQDVGDFRLLSRIMVDRLNAMPEQDRFLRGMVAWLGGRQTEILYDRDARSGGKTGYSLGKMLKLATAGVTSFSTAPLKAAVVLAFVGMAFGIVLIPFALVAFFTGGSERGWTSLALISVFFGVGQLGCLAIIGAYVGRIFMQVKARPLYLVSRVVRTTTPVDG
jgi:glycosyltransferase involved in cell wall biosynthesis